MGDMRNGLPAEAGTWLEELRSALQASELSQETSDVVGYYEEFLMDALEEGRALPELLARFGAPAQVVSVTVSERSIRAAEKKPGPFRLVSAARKTLKATATAAGRAALWTAALVPLLSGLLLYLGGFIFFLLPTVLLVGLLIESPAFSASADTKAGLVGLALFLGGLSLGCGWLLWRGANGLTRTTMRMLRRSLHPEEAEPVRERSEQEDRRVRRRKTLGRIGASVLSGGILLGLILLVGSNMAYNYYSIWMSMAPKQSVATDRAFPADGVREVRVEGQNSPIRFETVEGDEITVRMDTPDWMDPEVALADGVLRIEESGNGRLPFFRLLSIHEGVTVIRVGIPKDRALEALHVLTNGGDVFVGVPAGALEIWTTTGDIGLLEEYYAAVPQGVGSDRGAVTIGKDGEEG